MTMLSRTKLLDTINSTNGKFFSVTFEKKDGTLRDMVARKGVTKHLKGGVNLAVKPSNGLIVAFDVAKTAYRTINLDTVCRLKYKGQTYQIV